MKCQRRILGIRWHDFVRNSAVSLRTGLAPVSDQIIRGRNAIFAHVARLPDQHSSTPGHAKPSRAIGRSTPDPSWKRPPGRPRTKLTDQLTLQVSVAEWLARLTAVTEDPGSNHAADSCVYRDSCCDIQS